MIKVGTLCIVVGGFLRGRIVTTATTLYEHTALGVDGRMFTALAYGVSFAGPPPNHPVRPVGSWCVRPQNLRPLNDPDSAPAYPAYTKRKEHA